MKNTRPLFFILLLFAMTAGLKAQISIGLSGGLSLPLGTYQDYTSRALGKADMGGHFGLGLHYQIHKNLSIGINASHILHAVDAQQTAEGIWDEYKTAASVHVTATPYQLTAILLGVQPQTGWLLNRFSLYAGLSGGALVAQSPTFTQEIALSSPLHQTIDGATSTALALQGEIGLQWRVHNNIGLGLYANYLTSKPTFDFVRSDKTDAPTESAELHIQSANVGMRLIYRFQRHSAVGL